MSKKFKIDPQRLLPDLHLQLVRDLLTLLAELSCRDPQLRDRLRAATAP